MCLVSLILTVLQVRPVDAVLRGPRHDQASREADADLEVALGALRERVGVLRDQIAVRTEQCLERVDATVSSIQQEIKETALVTSSKLDGIDQVQQTRAEARQAMDMMMKFRFETAACMHQTQRPGGHQLKMSCREESD